MRFGLLDWLWCLDIDGFIFLCFGIISDRPVYGGERWCLDQTRVAFFLLLLSVKFSLPFRFISYFSLHRFFFVSYLLLVVLL